MNLHPSAMDYIPEHLKEQPAPAGIRSVLAEREATYGDFEHQARTAQELKIAMRVSPNWTGGRLAEDVKETLELIMTKVSRILHGNPDHIDSWVDIEGYAHLITNRLTTGDTKSE